MEKTITKNGIIITNIDNNIENNHINNTSINTQGFTIRNSVI